MIIVRKMGRYLLSWDIVREVYIVYLNYDIGDLHERIRKQGIIPFPSELIFKWFLQTALVLHYLHRKHVIHRDIKPQNLFLNEV